MRVTVVTLFLVAIFVGCGGGGGPVGSGPGGTQFVLKSGVVESAGAEEIEQGLYGVRIVLSASGRKAYARFTAAQKGQTIELVAGGETIASIPIASEVTDGMIFLMGPEITKEKAEEIAAKVPK